MSEGQAAPVLWSVKLRDTRPGHPCEPVQCVTTLSPCCWQCLAECEFSRTKMINIFFSEVWSQDSEAPSTGAVVLCPLLTGPRPSKSGPSQQVHLGSVVQQQRCLEAPSRDNHTLECVALAQISSLYNISSSFKGEGLSFWR